MTKFCSWTKRSIFTFINKLINWNIEFMRRRDQKSLLLEHAKYYFKQAKATYFLIYSCFWIHVICKKSYIIYHRNKYMIKILCFLLLFCLFTQEQRDVFYQIIATFNISDSQDPMDTIIPPNFLKIYLSELVILSSDSQGYKIN